MILVTLGTQDKPFTRLIDAVIEQISLGNIKEKVVMQIGQTNYNTDYQNDLLEIFDFVSMKQMDKLIDDARIIITHAGVGTITSGLIKEKKMIVAARLKKYNEHVNDHQLQILESFVAKGYVLAISEFSNLNSVLKEIDNFNPKPYKSNNKEFTKKLERYIENI